MGRGWWVAATKKNISEPLSEAKPNVRNVLKIYTIFPLWLQNFSVKMARVRGALFTSGWRGPIFMGLYIHGEAEVLQNVRINGLRWNLYGN